jgi:hypothetical protein
MFFPSFNQQLKVTFGGLISTSLFSSLCVIPFFPYCVENIWTEEGWSDGRVEKAA